MTRHVADELVTLLVDEPLLSAVPRIIAATRAASSAPVAVVRSEGGGSRIDLLLRSDRPASSRVVVVADSERRARSLWRLVGPDFRVRPELALRERIDSRDAAWLGRLITRTRLGLALGAGGARGWAHVGAIEVLDRAGYAIDAVSGTSIGAVVGTLVALERTPAEIAAAMRRLFSPENVEQIFRLSLSGASPGRARMIELLRAATGEQARLEELRTPLTVMAVDLDAGRPAPLRSGAVWEALAAATALPGMFAPCQLDGRRMIDALPLAPLPVEHLTGADVSVAIDVTPQCECQPSGSPHAPRLLAALGETIEAVAAHAARREAEFADIVLRPRLGTAPWKDFSLAEQHVEAGRGAARAALAQLARRVRPCVHQQATKGAADAVHSVHA